MTPEEIADEIVDGILYNGWHGPHAREAIANAIREEREACARVALDEANDKSLPLTEYGKQRNAVCVEIAAAIRARNNRDSSA